MLGEALQLWRGPALADLEFEPFAPAEIARLEEMRLGAIEQRLEADLALGRHDEVVAELETLIGRNPLREHFRHQLMLALYRSARQAEALDAYRRARQELADELGLEPSESLKQLEAAILRQDPELALALRMSLEEDRARQERERKTQEDAEGKTALDSVPEGSESQPLLDSNGEATGSGEQKKDKDHDDKMNTD